MKPLGAAFIMFVRIREQRHPHREPSECGCAARNHSAPQGTSQRQNPSTRLAEALRRLLGARPAPERRRMTEAQLKLRTSRNFMKCIADANASATRFSAVECSGNPGS